MNGSSLLLNIDKGADMKGNAFVFKRFNGFRMNHVGAIIAQFNRVYIRKFRNEFRIIDRKSTRLNSSHVKISYAVFCLKKKKTHKNTKSNLLKDTNHTVN